MTTVVLHAHPRDDSYSAALFAAVVGDRPEVRSIRICHGDVLDADSLVGATALVAVYPTWWGSPPAQLLAALNEVIGPWVDGPRPSSPCPLEQITSLTVVTTHGSSRLINRLQGEPGLQLWKRTVLPLCAPRATFTWRSLYKLDRATPDDRTNFLRSTAEACVPVMPVAPG